MFKQLLTLVPLFFGVLVDSFADPGSCSGACNSHDPSVIQRASDGVYFQFNTGGLIQIKKATSLNGPWTVQGNVLSGAAKVTVTGNPGTDVWAPDVHLIDGTYYLYYAVSTFGSQNSALGVASSTTMEVGSWTDHGSIGIASDSTKPYNAIDPNLIQVGSTLLMNFGSFWHDIYQVPMASPTSHGSASSYNIAFNSTGTDAEEGSYMFFFDGFYYLLISSGICCNYNVALPAPGAEYRTVMCRSTSPTGGFVDQSGKACTANGGTTLTASHDFVYGPGGGGVFIDSKLGPVFYYHYANKNIGIADSQYQFGFNVLGFSNGWPVA